MLEWDQTDFTAFMEVVPEEFAEECHGPFSIFLVERKGIQLEIAVFPFEEDVRFRLIRTGEETPFFEYQIMHCRSVKFEKSKDGTELLRFINQADMHIILSIKPDIRLRINESGF